MSQSQYAETHDRTHKQVAHAVIVPRGRFTHQSLR